MKHFAEKCLRKRKTSKEYVSFIVKNNAQPGNNSTLYKTHKPNVPVRCLTTGCNTSIFVAK